MSFVVGDRVMLSTSDLRTDGRARKLIAKYIGPFVIKRVIGAVAYELELPVQYSTVHPVFHVSKLKKYIDGDASFPARVRVARPLPDVMADTGEEAWKVREIVDKRERRVEVVLVVRNVLNISYYGRFP